MSIDKTKDYLANEIRLVLVGKTGAGKSATGNTIVGEKKFKSVADAKSVTQGCQQVMCERFRRYLQVIDVPGFLDTTKNAEEVNREIAQCLTMASPGIHAILFIVRIGRYTEEDVKTVREFIDLFGPKSQDFVIVVFAGLDDLMEDNSTVETYIQNSPVSLKHFLREVNNRYLAVNNRSSEQGKDQFVHELLGKIEQMLRDNGRSYFTSKHFAEAEEHLKELDEAKLKEIEKKNKVMTDAKIAEAIAQYRKELEKEKLSAEIKSLKVAEKREEQIHIIHVENQRDARQFTREETSKQIGSRSAASFLLSTTTGAATGAVTGALLGPGGATVGAVIGGAVGAVKGFFGF